MLIKLAATVSALFLIVGTFPRQILNFKQKSKNKKTKNKKQDKRIQ